MMRSACLALLLVPCGIAGAPQGLTSASPASPASQIMQPVIVPMPSAAPGQVIGLQAVVQAARADAAQRSGVPIDAVALVSAQAVVWRDGSLGCPQPGMSYTQALVNGFRVQLRAGVASFDYHASQRGGMLLCPSTLAVEPLPDTRI
jgi:hypothetical protein